MMKNCPEGQIPDTWVKVREDDDLVLTPKNALQDAYAELTRLREENTRLREALEQVKTSLVAHNLNREECPFDFGEGFGGTFDIVDEILS